MIQASSKLPEYPGMTRTLFFDISIVDPAYAGSVVYSLLSGAGCASIQG